MHFFPKASFVIGQRNAVENKGILTTFHRMERHI